MAQILQLAQTWQISGDMTLPYIAPLLETSAHLPVEGQMTVDLSAVTGVDTATISLLLEWSRRFKAQNCQMCLSGLPSKLTSLTQLYGVSHLMSSD
jgi:phospholipid transport system transporter-binding protein